MSRKICVITGTRADYGILYPVMKAIEGSGKAKLFVIATSMHLMKEFGHTVDQIKRDGFKIYEKVDVSYKDDTGQAMAYSIGQSVCAFSKTFQRLKPDVVMLLGDRGEMLAAAIAASYMNIPVTHIHGGEISGHVDGIVRHALTKLSHLHFAATKEARQRIIRLGEEPWRVKVTGAPALDRILNGHATSKKELVKKYKLDLSKPLAILLQHPLSSNIVDASKQIVESVAAVTDLKIPTVILYPNADAGGRAMIKSLSKFKDHPLLKHFKSISQEDYFGLLRIASVLVGNSSSGIIEAASFRLGVVNVGDRQKGRQHASNVLDARHDREDIKKAVRKVLNDTQFKKRLARCQNIYGDGKAAQRIVGFLTSVSLDGRLLTKQITY